MSLDSQLCLDLNRIARSAPALRHGVVISQYVVPAVAAALSLVAGLRRPERPRLAAALPLVGGALSGAIGIVVVALIGVRAAPLPVRDVLVHPSLLVSLPDAHAAALAALAVALAALGERFAATLAALLALIEAAADTATGAVAPSSALAGLALGLLLAGAAGAAALASRRPTASPRRLAPRLSALPAIALEGSAVHQPIPATGAVRLLEGDGSLPEPPAPRRVAPPIEAPAADRLPSGIRLLPRAAGEDGPR